MIHINSSDIANPNPACNFSERFEFAGGATRMHFNLMRLTCRIVGRNYGDGAAIVRTDFSMPPSNAESGGFDLLVNCLLQTHSIIRRFIDEFIAANHNLHASGRQHSRDTHRDTEENPGHAGVEK